MRVMLTDPPNTLFVQGELKGVIKSEQDGHYPNMVIEMAVSGRGPVEVTLDQLDLFTIVRLARESKVEKLRDAVRR
jgi:hypothetical protein